MSSKKGFTLIELSAVIVIFAIITLIATPIVLNTVIKARKGAAIDSAYEYVKAIEYQNHLAQLEPDKYNKILSGDVSGIILKVKDLKPDSGNITIDKNKVIEAELCIDRYKIIYQNSVAEVANDSSECRIENQEESNNSSNTTFGGELQLEPAGSTKTYDGIVYLDPKDLTATCTHESTLTSGNTGCKKFYIYDDSNNQYKMIMDRNTTTTIAWMIKSDFIDAGGKSSDWNTKKNEKGPVTLNNQLAIDTAGWIGSPRLISADEIAHIVGADSNNSLKWSSNKPWNNTYNDYADLNPSTNVSWYYLDGSGTTYSENNGWRKKATTSNYSWLVENLVTSETLSNISQSGSFSEGYWTKTAVNGDSNFAYIVKAEAMIDRIVADNDTTYGIRPVITLLKSQLN